MPPEVLYTTIIASISIGFVALTFIFWFFIEDRFKYHVTGLALASIVAALLLEQPSLAFAPVQVVAIPVGSVIALAVFAFLTYQYLKAKYPY